MRKLKKYLILFIVLGLYSCKSGCNVEGIEVNGLLLTVSNEKSYDYCSSLEKAISGNKNSIKELSLLDFEDSSGYSHGEVLVGLIDKVGEDKFIDAISMLQPKDKNKILAYLEVGIMYNGNKSLNDKKVKDVFPQLYQFLVK